MPKLKVYGWTGFYPLAFAGRTKNCHFVMAAPSKAAVYRATGKQAHDHYAVSETHNEHSVKVALAKPGAVFFQDTINHTPGENVYVECKPEDAL